MAGPLNNPGGSPALPPGLSQLKRRKKYRLRRRKYSAMPLLEAGAAAAGAGDSSNEVQRLRNELDKKDEELKEANDRALRNRADLENFRRRVQKEKEDLRKFGSEDLMRSLLPPMDHFELALQSLDSATDIDSIRQGVTMIHREIIGVLQQNGLELLQPQGEAFDPSKHEAASTTSDPDQPDNVVVEVMRPGWSLRGRILRPAMVSVNKVG